MAKAKTSETTVAVADFGKEHGSEFAKAADAAIDAATMLPIVSDIPGLRTVKKIKDATKFAYKKYTKYQEDKSKQDLSVEENQELLALD